MLQMTMAVFERSFQISNTMKSFEDLRFLVALRLSRNVSFMGVCSFEHGFWAEVFGSTPGADEYEAFALQFYYVFAGCGILITDEDLRTNVMALWREFLEVYHVTRTGVHSWWNDDALSNLRRSQDGVVTRMKEVQELLESPVPLSHKKRVSDLNKKTGGNSVGVGFAIEKLGEWRYIPDHLKKVGSLSSTSTKVFENTNIRTKKADAAVSSRRSFNHNSILLRKLERNETLLASSNSGDSSSSSRTGSKPHLGIGQGGCAPCRQLWDVIQQAFNEVPSIAPQNFSEVPLMAFAAVAGGGVASATYFSRIRFSASGHDILPSHFILTCTGSYAQFIAGVADGLTNDLFAVAWLFEDAAPGLHVHPAVMMPHIKRCVGDGSIAIIPVISISTCVQVLPFQAGQGPSLTWKPGSDTAYMVNTMVSHLEPLKGAKEEGSVPFRICPRCTRSRIPKPTSPEVFVTCSLCTEHFRW
jgi:hypothetical protein